MKIQYFKFFILNMLLVLLLSACNDDNGKQTQGKIIKNAVKDADGNIYDAVKIGDQVWMASNLRTTRYEDGTPISLGNSDSKGGGHRYYPDGKASNVEKYGYLYDWDAVMKGESGSNANPSEVQGICPNGWHVPSNDEWQDLINYVEYQIETGELVNTTVAKALASIEGWKTSSGSGTPGYVPSANNSTGFSAVPAGAGNSGVSEYTFGRSAYFWSATEGNSSDDAYLRHLSYNKADMRREYASKYVGFSVRCLRGKATPQPSISATQLLTDNRGWHLVEGSITPAYEMHSGDKVSDLMDYLYNCEKDDEIYFYDNGTERINPMEECQPGDGIHGSIITNWHFDNDTNPQVLYMQLPFVYKYNASGEVIGLDDAVENCKILSLTADKMVLSWTFSKDGNTYTYTMIYRHINQY